MTMAGVEDVLDVSGWVEVVVGTVVLEDEEEGAVEVVEVVGAAVDEVVVVEGEGEGDEEGGGEGEVVGAAVVGAGVVGAAVVGAMCVSGVLRFGCPIRYAIRNGMSGHDPNKGLLPERHDQHSPIPSLSLPSLRDYDTVSPARIPTSSHYTTKSTSVTSTSSAIIYHSPYPFQSYINNP